MSDGKLLSVISSLYASLEFSTVISSTSCKMRDEKSHKSIDLSLCLYFGMHLEAKGVPRVVSLSLDLFKVSAHISDNHMEYWWKKGPDI